MDVAQLIAEHERLVGENERLVHANDRLRARLDGMVSVVASVSLGESSFGEFASNVCDDLQACFQADVAVLYFVEDYGFRVTGRSHGFDELGIAQTFVPTGTGVPTMVMRNRRAVRMELNEPADADGVSVMTDVAFGTRVRLHSDMARTCSMLMGAPIFSYDRVVAVVLIGWAGGYRADEEDERLLMTVADYLSVELAAMVSQTEQVRATALARSHNEINALLKNRTAMTGDLLASLAARIGLALGCTVLTLVQEQGSGCAYLRLRDGEGAYSRLDMPYGLDDLFEHGARLARVDAASPCGLWVARHTDLVHGWAMRFPPGDADPHAYDFALLVMRGVREVPFDQAEREFLRRVSADVSLSIREGRRHENEAKIAKALQMGLRNVLPEAKGVTCASLYISATESALVGGDFFDLYEVSEGHVVVVIGDVSGKGVEAAAMASLVKTALAAYAFDELEPAQMLGSLNNLFLNFSRLETFASMVVVSLDLAGRTALYCSGGHPPAMVVHGPHTAHPELELLTVQSPIVGAFEDMEYSNGSFTYDPGDVLYLYTDGTTEARAADGTFFGEDNLRLALLRAGTGDVADVPQSILNAVQDFAAGDLHDDIGMVAVRIDGV